MRVVWVYTRCTRVITVIIIWRYDGDPYNDVNSARFIGYSLPYGGFWQRA